VAVPADARYREIAADLRRKIEAGDIEPGQRLPSERELGDHYRVSRITVRAAIEQLAHSGLVTTRQGRGGGSFVRRTVLLMYWASRAERGNSEIGESDAYFGEVISQGQAPSQTITVERLVVPVDITELLGLAEGTIGILRRCVRSINGVPNAIQDTWYPMDLAGPVPELLGPADIARGTTWLLRERGVCQVSSLDENLARMPSSEERRLLALARGTPVLEHRRTGYTADGRPVRVSVNIFAGDTTRIMYRLGDAEG
jgi:GntR family transcriptional regulator